MDAGHPLSKWSIPDAPCWQDIANYLGLAVETVSRLFAHLQDADIIEVDRRRVNICDMDRLQAIIGDSNAINAVKARQG